jgi:hypothetical protein
MHRERVREGGRLEVDVRAAGQCGCRLAVDTPLAGPLTLEPHVVGAERRPPFDANGAGRPGRVEGDRVADSPRLAFLDRRRVPLDPVAVWFGAQEDHLESVTSPEVAPGRGGGEIDHPEKARAA